MRKGIMISVLLITFMMLYPGMVNAAPAIIIDGKQLTFDVSPTTINGRLLVPLRTVFEELGATVHWDAANQEITASQAGTNVVLRIGNETAMVNKETITLEAIPKIVNNRTLIPLRFVSEALGSQVNWDEKNNIVTIKRLASTDQPPSTDNNAQQNASIAALSAPQEVVAAPVSDASIHLKWNEVPGATKYEIYMKPMFISNSYRLAETTDKAQTSINSLVSSSPYWFKVRAKSETATSSFSNEVKTTTLDPRNIQTSLSSPAPVGEHFILNRQADDYNGACKIDIALEQIKSGKDAWKTIQAASNFNKAPGNNEEYILVRFKIKIIEPTHMSIIINHTHFNLVNKDGNVYNNDSKVRRVFGMPYFDNMYEDGICTGWISLLKVADDYPRVVFDKGKNTEVWFSLDDD